MATNSSKAGPPSSKPVTAQFASDRSVIGGGVAIFHVASSRVVVVFDPTHQFWFLPKGRRDIHESTQAGAEREGFEESGYRNRVLPIPFKHRQPQPRIPLDPRLSTFSGEPIWTQLMPQSSTSQYLLFWFIAETLPPEAEAELDAKTDAGEASIFGKPYVYPPEYPVDLKLKDRIAMEPKGYEPVRHTETTNDPEEMLYESHLLPIEDAMEKLRGSVQADVIKRGWEAIQLRLSMEA